MNRLSENIGKRNLRMKLKNFVRQKSLQNFKLAKSAVIVFDTDIENCFQPVKDFSKYLSSQEIKSRVFGYVPQKEIPDNMTLWKNFDYFTTKDINWFGKPKGPVSEKYYGLKPDILFVFSLNPNLSIDYLTQLSEAKFKVGCYEEEKRDLDLMINPGKSNCEIGFFIEQVKHYLNILRPIN